MEDKKVINPFIPQEYLSNYIHTYIYVFSNDGKKYSGIFQGFDNQNSIYLNECMKSEILESPDSGTHLGRYLFPISDIISIYSRDLPSPKNMNKAFPENGPIKVRNFCINDHCESMVTGVSPVGGYLGPHRGVGRHVQNQPFCNCTHIPLTFGPQTTTPLPMAMRPYLCEFGIPGNSSNSS